MPKTPDQIQAGNLKPSQLKKSRSAENISLKPDAPTLTKSKSAQEISPTQPSLPEQIKQLKQELAFTEHTAQNYLKRLQTLTAEFDQKDAETTALNQKLTQLE